MSVNKAILVGRLGRKPEQRTSQSGNTITTFSIATSERRKDQSGEWSEHTEWHNIVVWAGLAEICGKYLTKGKQVYLEGRIQNRSYDDRDGNKRYITEIVANEMQMLGSRGGGTANFDRGDAAPAAAEPAPPAPASAGSAAAGATAAAEEFDDDIPF